jgi:hydrogenase small subunit
MEQNVPHGRVTQRPSPVPEVHILWMTSGLGCDGDSVSITAATQPSIEDVILGAIPGLPKVHLHNPVLAYETGDDFLKFWHMASRGQPTTNEWIDRLAPKALATICAGTCATRRPL